MDPLRAYSSIYSSIYSSPSHSASSRLPISIINHSCISTDTTTGSPGRAQPVARRGAITGGMKVQRSLDESGRSVGARGSGTALHHSSQERLTGHKDVSLSDTALSKSVAGSEEQLDEVSSEGKAGEDVGSDSGSKTGGVRTKTPAGGSSSKLAQLTGSKEGDLNKIKSSSTSQLSSAGQLCCCVYYLKCHSSLPLQAILVVFLCLHRMLPIARLPSNPFVILS